MPFDPGYCQEPFRTLVQDVPDSTVQQHPPDLNRTGRTRTEGHTGAHLTAGGLNAKAEHQPRVRLDTATGSHPVKRDAKGQFKETNSVGGSRPADRRTTASAP